LLNLDFAVQTVVCWKICENPISDENQPYRNNA
jgi:hypothetical protein